MGTPGIIRYCLVSPRRDRDASNLSSTAQFLEEEIEARRDGGGGGAEIAQPGGTKESGPEPQWMGLLGSWPPVWCGSCPGPFKSNGVRLGSPV